MGKLKKFEIKEKGFVYRFNSGVLDALDKQIVLFGTNADYPFGDRTYALVRMNRSKEDDADWKHNISNKQENRAGFNSCLEIFHTSVNILSLL